MDNQHRKITGYRELSQQEIDLMNEIKKKGEELQALCDNVGAHIVKQQIDAAGDKGELARLGAASPWAWHQAAKIELQSGMMKLVRSVAQPTTF